MSDPIDLLPGFDQRYTRAATTPLSDLDLRPIPEPQRPGWFRRLFGAQPGGPDPSVAEGNIDTLEAERDRLVGADERLRRFEHENVPQAQAESRQATRKVITSEKLAEIEAEIAKQSPHTSAGQAEAKKRADKSARKAADKKSARTAGIRGAVKGGAVAGAAVGAGMSLYNWGKSSVARPGDVFLDTGQTFSRQHMDLAADAIEAGTPIADLPQNVRDAALAMIDMARDNPDLYGAEAAALINSYGSRAASDLQSSAGAGLEGGAPAIGNGNDVPVAPQVGIEPGSPRAEVADEVSSLGERARAGDETAIEQLNYLIGVSDAAPSRGGMDWAITAAEGLFTPEEIANLAGITAAPAPSDAPPEVDQVSSVLASPSGEQYAGIIPAGDGGLLPVAPPVNASASSPAGGWGAAQADQDGGGLTPSLADAAAPAPALPIVDAFARADAEDFLQPDAGEQVVFPALTANINALGPKTQAAIEGLHGRYNPDNVAVHNGITQLAEWAGRLENAGVSPEQLDTIMASVVPTLVAAAPGALAGGKIGGGMGALVGGAGSALGLTEDVTNLIHAGLRDAGYSPEESEALLGTLGAGTSAVSLLHLAPAALRQIVTKNPWGLAATAALGPTAAGASDASAMDPAAMQFLADNPAIAAELDQILATQGMDVAMAALGEAMGTSASAPAVPTEAPDSRVSPPGAPGPASGGRPEAPATLAATDEAEALPEEAVKALTGTLDRRDGPEVIKGRSSTVHDGGINSGAATPQASLDTAAQDAIAQEQVLRDGILASQSPHSFGGTPVSEGSADPALNGSTLMEDTQSAAALVAQGVDARGGIKPGWKDQSWAERFGLDSQEGRNRFGTALSRFGTALATTPGDFLEGLNHGFSAATGAFDEYDQEAYERAQDLRDEEAEERRWQAEMNQRRSIADMTHGVGMYDSGFGDPKEERKLNGRIVNLVTEAQTGNYQPDVLDDALVAIGMDPTDAGQKHAFKMALEAGDKIAWAAYEGAVSNSVRTAYYGLKGADMMQRLLGGI